MYIIRQIKYYKNIISDVISHNKSDNICKRKLNKTSSQTQFLRVKELRSFWDGGSKLLLMSALTARRQNSGVPFEGGETGQVDITKRTRTRTLASLASSSCGRRGRPKPSRHRPSLPLSPAVPLPERAAGNSRGPWGRRRRGSSPSPPVV